MKLKQIALATTTAVALVGPALAADPSQSMKQESQKQKSQSAYSTYDSSTMREAQQALQQRGLYEGEIDGVWGPQTRAALQRFQEREGLFASGRLEPATLAKLEVRQSDQHMQSRTTEESAGAMHSRTTEASRSASMTYDRYDPDTVRAAQQALQDQGFDVGGVDGIWGPKSRAALIDFQEREGLFASGRLEPDTLAKLQVQLHGNSGMQSRNAVRPESEQRPEYVRDNPRTIRAAQQALHERGFDVGSIDGTWGPQTKAAVYKFQQQEGLEMTGWLNPQTLAKLNVAPDRLNSQADVATPRRQGG